MTRHTAFLRAINVGGHTVKSPELVAVFTGLGFDDVSTFLASGNVLFSAPGKSGPLEGTIEQALKSALGYDVTTFVRAADEVAGVASASPFGSDAAGAKVTLHVGFLKGAPTAAQRKAVAALSNDTDQLAVEGREVYWRINGGFSDATVKDKDILKALGGVETTWRNMNTVRRLAQKLA